MAFFGVTLEKIEKVEIHPNADRLSIAKLENLSFQFVIGKDQFKVGDQVLYFPIDSVLPLEVMKVLKLEGKLAGKEKNRVKTLKLRQEISQGVVGEVSKFLTPDQLTLSSEEITALLGVTKYDPPIQISSSGILAPLPSGYGAYDIEGADRYQFIIDELMDTEVVITEKMEGINYSAGKNEAGLFVNQRNHSIIETDTPHTLWELARRTSLLEKIKEYPSKDLIIYGEFCGPKMQGNLYELKEHTLFVFDVKVNHKWLSFDEYMDLTKALNLTIAPILFEGKLRDYLQGKTVQEASNGASMVNPNALREGIVIKPKIEQYHPKLGRLIIKQRSPQYLAQSDN